MRRQHLRVERLESLGHARRIIYAGVERAFLVLQLLFHLLGRKVVVKRYFFNVLILLGVNHGVAGGRPRNIWAVLGALKGAHLSAETALRRFWLFNSREILRVRDRMESAPVGFVRLLKISRFLQFLFPVISPNLSALTNRGCLSSFSRRPLSAHCLWMGAILLLDQVSKFFEDEQLEIFKLSGTKK